MNRNPLRRKPIAQDSEQRFVACAGCQQQASPFKRFPGRMNPNTVTVF